MSALGHRWWLSLSVILVPTALPAQQVTVEGLVTMVWIDPVVGPPPPPRVFLYRVTGQPLELRWPGGPPADLQVLPGDRWRVSGTMLPSLAAPDALGTRTEILQVTNRQVLSRSALRSEESTLRYLGLMCEAADGQPWSSTPVTLESMLGPTSTGVGHFLAEASEGQLDFAAATVRPPVTLAGVVSTYGNHTTTGVNLDLLTSDCVEAAVAGGGLSLDSIDGLVLFVNFPMGSAFGGTTGVTVDGTTHVFRAAWMPQPQNTPGVLTHEVGHSIGWSHSGSDNGPHALNMYDSHWDVMSAANFGQFQTIAVNRAASGWVPDARWARVTPGTEADFLLEIVGSGRIGPRAATGVDLVEVRSPGGRRWSLEPRLKRGQYDGEIPAGGVILHRLTRPIALGLSCCLAKLIDGDNNGHVLDEGVTWTVGEEFRDPVNGMTMTVLDSLTDGFTVRVRSGWQLSAEVDGDGRISGLGAGDCHDSCRSLHAVPGATATLTAVETTPGQPFRRWFGDCQGTGTCVVPLDRDAVVTAWFGPGVAFVSSAERPLGIVGESYADQVELDAIGPASLALVAGSLPPGLTFDPATGTISGVPGTPGRFTFELRVTAGADATTRQFSQEIHPPLALSPGDTLSLVRFTTNRVPLANGSGHAATIVLAGGEWPIGMAPTATGELVGIPTSSGSESATFDVTQNGATIRRTIHFRTVSARPVITTDSNLRDGYFGLTYSLQLETAAWRDTVAFSIVSGELHPGLSLSADGRISGTPLEGGIRDFTVETRLGSLVEQKALHLGIGEPQLTRADVLRSLTTGIRLNSAEEAYLDIIGNRNGSFDLGDVRAWLIRHGHLTLAGAKP